MPEILTETSRAFTFTARQMGFTDPALLETHNVVLVGWSERARRICCRAYDQQPGAGGFVGQEYLSWYFAPGIQSVMQIPANRNIEDLIEVANAQVRRMHAEASGEAAGGRLITALIIKDRMTISNQCELPAPVITRKTPDQ